jgi:GH43 family beta-xylosidase
MENPWTLKGEPVMLSKPEYDWECRGFWVNEGPAVLVHGDKLFISYSASATDENYCMGLLWIDLNADPQNPANWHKSRARYSPPATKIASTARAQQLYANAGRGRCAGVSRAELHRN